MQPVKVLGPRMRHEEGDCPQRVEPMVPNAVHQIEGVEVVADVDDDELCGLANSCIVSELPCRL